MILVIRLNLPHREAVHRRRSQPDGAEHRPAHFSRREQQVPTILFRLSAPEPELARAMLFAHLKRILRLDRMRLRGPNGARDEFHLAATAQNLRKLAKLIPMPMPAPA